MPFVHAKKLTQAGMAEEEAIELAKNASFDTLSRIEQRAVEQLIDANAAAANPYIERQATKLAWAVRKEWPTELAQKGERSRGRPRGSHAKAIVTLEGKILVPISIREAVAIALPEIEKLIGGEVSPSLLDRLGHNPRASSPALEAVVLAVQLISPGVELSGTALETIRSEVARVHSEGGNRRRADPEISRN